MTQSPWTFVAAVMVTGFLVVAQIYAILPLLPVIERDMDITDMQASFIPAAFGLAYALGLFVFGPVADKFDRLTLLVAGLVALSAATALAALAATYWTLIAARVLQGLAAASFPATALALVSERVPRKDQPLAISTLGFAFLSSAPLSQLIVGSAGLALGALMGWVAALYALCAAAIYASGPKTPSDAVPSAARAAAGDLAAALRLPPAAAFVLAPSTVLLCLVSFHALCQLLATADPTLDPQLLRLVGFPPLFLCFVAPTITKRSGPAVTACCGLVVTAIGMAIGGLGLGLILASIIVSAGVAVAVPGLIAAVTFWSGEQVRARALATYTFFLFAGASIAPVIANALFRMDVAVAFGIPAAATLGAAVAMYLTRPGRTPLDAATGGTSSSAH